MFELFKNNKGQISVEVLTIVGILVIGGIIFGVFYLSQINKSIDDADQLDASMGNNFGDILDPVGVGNVLPNCFDRLLNGQETGVDCGGPDCDDCSIPGDCGDGICDVAGGECETCLQDCEDEPGCEVGVPSPFEIILDPATATGIVGQNYSGLGTKIVLHESAFVNLFLTVKKYNLGILGNTNECTYDGSIINGSTPLGKYVSDFTLNKNINCSQEDTYYFEFYGIDESSHEVTETFIFTTVSDINPPGPGPGNDYSFCSVSALLGGSDTLRVCLNDYTTTLNLGNSDYLKVYVNQPDALENNCQSTLKGNKVCVYVGNSWR